MSIKHIALLALLLSAFALAGCTSSDGDAMEGDHDDSDGHDDDAMMDGEDDHMDDGDSMGSNETEEGGDGNTTAAF